MPGPYGLTSTGFVAKPLADIKSDLEASFRSTFGNGIDVSADSAMGEVIGIFADRLADLWQGAQALYTNAFPDGASGVALDSLCAITGTARQPATQTRVMATVVGTPATVITTAARVSVTGVGTLFKPAASITIPIGGSISAEFMAVETGPKPAPAGTLTTIVTPVAGWASLSNPLDQFALGRNIETDAALRLRRELSLRAIGGATLEAIRAAVAEVPGVVNVNVFENTTSTTDASGLPPNSFEVVALGGTNAAVGQSIFDRKPAGVRSYGTTTVGAADSLGVLHDVSFSRPTTLPGYVTLTVKARGPAPGNLADLIAAAIVEFGDSNLSVGDPFIATALIPSVFKADPSIVDVPSVLIGTAPSPVSSVTLVATNRQLFDLDTSRVVVNIVFV